MSLSLSALPAGSGPRCLFANEEAKRIVHSGAVAIVRITALAARIALALLMAGLAAAQPRLLPLFALTLPFWLAIELEPKAARRATPSHIRR